MVQYGFRAGHEEKRQKESLGSIENDGNDKMI